MSEKNIIALRDEELTGVAGGVADPDAQQLRFQIVLTDRGQSAMSVIKGLMSLLGLSLREAKALVDSIPVTIRTDASIEEATVIKATMEKCGAKVTIALCHE